MLENGVARRIQGDIALSELAHLPAHILVSLLPVKVLTLAGAVECQFTGNAEWKNQEPQIVGCGAANITPNCCGKKIRLLQAAYPY